MIATDLQGIAEAVIRRAQSQGSVTAEDIQQELNRAGVSDEMGPDVLALCRRSLRRRQGRFVYVSAMTRPTRPEQQQRLIRRTIREVIRRHRDAQRVERRGQDRVDIIQPVRVVTEDGKERRLLSRDLSTSGIRLIGTRSLLGQKVCVHLGEGADSYALVVRILWTCAVGDELFENGGMFLDAAVEEK